MELLTSTDPDATGSDGLGAAQGMPDDRSPHSPGTSLAAVSGFQPGPLAQQMELLPKDAGRAAQSAAGCCDHYLQLGAAHGHCVQAQESERALKCGKKLILQVFFSWLGKEGFVHIRGQEQDFPLCAPLAIRTERPVQ